MKKTLVAEDTGIGRAIIGKDPMAIVCRLLDCLETLGLTGLRSVIEHGTGGIAGPAIAFCEKGVRYYGIDMHEGVFETSFVPSLRHHFNGGKIPDTISWHTGDITKMDLRREFGRIERPLLVLFFNSFPWVRFYARETRTFERFMQKGVYNRLEFELAKERLGNVADPALLAKKEIEENILSPAVVNIYYNFLKKGDAIACVSTRVSLPKDTGAAEFYAAVKNKKFRHKILIKRAGSARSGGGNLPEVVGVVCVK